MLVKDLADLVFSFDVYIMDVPFTWVDNYRSPALDKPTPKGTPCDYWAKLAPS